LDHRHSDRPKTGPAFLVVDDDPDVCQFVERMMQAMKLDVRSFSSAEEFLNSVTEEPHGCLIADMRMLGMSGLELLKELNARQWQLPTIVVSGYGDIRLAVDSFKAGAFTFLEKPYRSQELWEAVVQAIAVSQANSDKRNLKREVHTALSKLTPEEVNVLRELLISIPMKTIAAKYNFSSRTIDLRRKSILEKFKVETNVELAKKIVEAGINIDEV
jgi:two-component system, LuxR family, response regulator FixJ